MTINGLGMGGDRRRGKRRGKAKKKSHSEVESSTLQDATVFQTGKLPKAMRSCTMQIREQQLDNTTDDGVMATWEDLAEQLDQEEGGNEGFIIKGTRRRRLVNQNT